MTNTVLCVYMYFSKIFDDILNESLSFNNDCDLLIPTTPYTED